MQRLKDYQIKMFEEHGDEIVNYTNKLFEYIDGVSPEKLPKVMREAEEEIEKPDVLKFQKHSVFGA